MHRVSVNIGSLGELTVETDEDTNRATCSYRGELPLSVAAALLDWYKEIRDHAVSGQPG